MTIQLAGCVITDDQGRILLLHRQADGYDHWEIPGGKVEPEEETETAARRELQEELGVAVTIERELGQAKFTDRDRQFQYHFFLAHTDDNPRVVEADIFSEYAYQPLDQLLKPTIVLSGAAQAFVTLLKTGEITL